ncbi:hypothetical protein E2I00_015349 [Balaenoptera physalus]|uniref:Uncharacterized protein n=1 Tax=Balaenoptera physalus TaxID=9770 RepID=A0A643CAT4_BALPH|nr:hypothetical protein E2I00_015349 [Balaenoptera physalus]
MSESHNHASELVKHGASTRQQKRTCTSVTSKCGENCKSYIPFVFSHISIFSCLIHCCSYGDSFHCNGSDMQCHDHKLLSVTNNTNPFNNCDYFNSIIQQRSSNFFERLAMVEMQNGNCAVYGSSFKAYTENCLTPNTYICMQRIV